MPKFILFDEATLEILHSRESNETLAQFIESVEYEVRRMALKHPKKFSLASKLRVAEVDPKFSIKPAEPSERMKNIIETKRPPLDDECRR